MHITNNFILIRFVFDGVNAGGSTNWEEWSQSRVQADQVRE